MLIALLLASAQASQPAPPPSEERIDATATMIAMMRWRICLDLVIGPPPRPHPPRKEAREAAFEACREFEDTMRKESAAAFGAERGAELLARSIRTARSELGDTEVKP